MNLSCKTISRKTQSVVVSCLAVVATALASGSAIAGDAKIFPGAECVPETPSTSVEPKYKGSAIGNPSSTETLSVRCPATRDVIAGYIQSGLVQVVDQNRAENVECTLWRLHWSGGPNFSGTSDSDSSSLSSSFLQNLNFGSLSFRSNAHYAYFCDIPPADSGDISYVISYKLTEQSN